MYVMFPIASRAAARAARTATPTRAGSAPSRSSCGCRTAASTARPASSTTSTPTVAPEHRHDHAARRHPQPGPRRRRAPASPVPRELIDGEFVTVLLEGVEPVAGARPFRAPRCCRTSRATTSMSSTRKNKARAAAHPARPVHARPTAVIARGLKEGEKVVVEGSAARPPGPAGRVTARQPGQPPPPARSAPPRRLGRALSTPDDLRRSSSTGRGWPSSSRSS